MIDDCDREIAEIKMDFEVLARPTPTNPANQVTSEGLRKALAPKHHSIATVTNNNTMNSLQT